MCFFCLVFSSPCSFPFFYTGAFFAFSCVLFSFAKRESFSLLSSSTSWSHFPAFFFSWFGAILECVTLPSPFFLSHNRLWNIFPAQALSFLLIFLSRLPLDFLFSEQAFPSPRSRIGIETVSPLSFPLPSPNTVVFSFSGKLPSDRFFFWGYSFFPLKTPSP